MAKNDTVNFSVSVTPIELLATENAGTESILASEVGKSLGGSGTANVASYAGSAADQGYKDAAVNYISCLDDSSTQISAETSASFVMIKNTGYYFDSATTLGSVATEHIVVTTENTRSTVIASLGPGEAFVLKALQATKTIDCTKIHVQTFEANGSAAGATDHLATEYLVVD